jgi:hypothetical protein
MPVGQSAKVPPTRNRSVSPAFSAALDSGGFALVPSSPPLTDRSGGIAWDGRTVFAERYVRRVGTHTGMQVSMGVLVGAGICLGAVDGLLVGGLWYTFPWFLGGLAAAGLLWWRYGRTYESEVIAARFLGAPRSGHGPVEGTGAPAGGIVVWSAGRVRSVLFSGTRTAVGVLDCPIPLMEGLGGVVRRFQSELGLGDAGSPVPAAS